MITKDKFLKDVAAEVRAIKKHATSEEIKNLDIDTLNPQSFDRCIYGQMAGNCTNARACELVFSCCKRYIIRESSESLHFDSFTQLKKQINGAKVHGVSSPNQLKRDWLSMRHFSSLEGYIMMPKSKNSNVISYLKGETKKLIL